MSELEAGLTEVKKLLTHLESERKRQEMWLKERYTILCSCLPCSTCCNNYMCMHVHLFISSPLSPHTHLTRTSPPLTHTPTHTPLSQTPPPFKHTSSPHTHLLPSHTSSLTNTSPHTHFLPHNLTTFTSSPHTHLLPSHTPPPFTHTSSLITSTSSLSLNCDEHTYAAFTNTHDTIIFQFLPVARSAVMAVPSDC